MPIEVCDDFLFEERECVGYIKGSQFLDESEGFLGFLSEDMKGNPNLKDESAYVKYKVENQDIIDNTMNRCIGIFEDGKILASDLEFSREFNANSELLEIHTNKGDTILKINTKSINQNFFFGVYVYYVHPNLSSYM